jgi:peptide/nickel transport system substrate-binding protein
MKKKYLSLALSLMLVTGLFAGCGGSTEAKSSETDGLKEVVELTVPEGLSSYTKIKFGDVSLQNPAASRDGSENTLVVGMTEIKGYILPPYNSTTYDTQVVKLVFDTLIGHDEEGDIDYKLADSFEYSNDNKTISFKLKEGVKFADGMPLTAEDVEFSFTALADPEYKDRFYSYVDKLVGYKEYKEGDATSIEGIKVINDYEMSFTFTDARADNIWNFDQGIMPKHIYGFEKGKAQEMKDKMNDTNIQGSGRYIVKEFVPKQYITFEANQNWYGGNVNVQNLIIKFTTPDTQFQELQAGNTDIQTHVAAKADNAAQIDDIGIVTTNVYPGNSYGYMGMNMRDERLSDVRVRQALTYGFNREAFINLYYTGNATVSNTPISQVSWAYSDKVNKYKYDADKAIELLEEAGWVMNDDGIREKDGKKLRFVWDTYTDSKYVETMIPMLKADWEKIGVKVEPNLMDFNSLVEKVYTKQDFELYNMAWTLDVDPGTNYTTFHSSAAVLDGNNSVGLEDEKIDQLLIAGALEFDQEKRAQIYQEFAVEINELLPYIFISQTDEWDLSNVRVRNLRVSPYCDWTYHIEEVELVNN